MAASIARNRMTRLERARPTQTDRDATKGLGVVDAASWVMTKLLVQRSGGCFGLLTAHCGKCGIEIHPHRLDDMTVEVLEAAAVHEAMVLRRAGVGLAARRVCGLDYRVHLRAAVARQAEQRLDRGARVDDRLGGE